MDWYIIRVSEGFTEVSVSEHISTFPSFRRLIKSDLSFLFNSCLSIYCTVRESQIYLAPNDGVGKMSLHDKLRKRDKRLKTFRTRLIFYFSFIHVIYNIDGFRYWYIRYKVSYCWLSWFGKNYFSHAYGIYNTAIRVFENYLFTFISVRLKWSSIMRVKFIRVQCKMICIPIYNL